MDPSERPPTSEEAFAEAIELLRSDRARGFNIDIETDTMVFEDQKAEKAARIEFISSVSGFLKEAVPAAQLYPQIAPVLVEMLMFGVRGFKAGRHLEQVFEQATDQLNESGEQPQQPKPDPKMQEVQAKLAADKERMAMEREDSTLRREADLKDLQDRFELARQKQQADIATEKRKLDMQVAAQNNRVVTDVIKAPEGVAPFDALAQALSQQAQAFQMLAQLMTAPKRVIRDPRTGRAEGVETVMPGSLQ